MNISHLVLPLLLGLSQLATPALAQELAVPDKEHLNGMSYEEYSGYREKMRMRMEKASPQEQEPMQEPDNRDRDTMNKPAQGSAYGQGYSSRNNVSNDKPETRPDSRPERPQIPERPQHERFDRSGMGRR